MTPRPSGLITGAALLAGAAATAAASAYHARHRAPYAPVLESVTVPSASRLPPSASRLPSPRGHPASRLLRIGFLTDTHLGPMVDVRHVARALDLLFEAAPDLLCLGGDFVCDSPRFIPEAAAVLGAYAGAAPLGAFAVLGNHDYSTDVVRLVTQFERKGIRVLRNEAAIVARDAVALWLVGLDDALLGRPDPARAFAAVPDGAAALALWHEPDWAAQVARRGALLQLSGHSHGGQIRLPFLGHLSAPTGGRRFVHGLNHADGMPVYTSRGLGVYHPPLRFRCPPEVTLVSLGTCAGDRLATDPLPCHAPGARTTETRTRG